MSGPEQGEKTLPATPQRREQFRKQGRFAKARDAGGLAATAAVAFVLLGSRASIGRAIDLLFVRTLGDLGPLSTDRLHEALDVAAGALAAIVGPAAAGAAAAAAAVGLAQAGLRFDLGALAWKPERLDPIPRLKELFAPKRGTVEVLLALAKVGAVGYVAYRALALELPRILSYAQTPVDDALHALIDATVRILFSAMGALAVIVVLDYAQSRFSLEREMKMTRKEMMDEHKQSDGDPKVKGKMRQKARMLAKKRALANVKTADVVVVNPTHIAVALRYGARDAAPVVVAKGHDELAMRIRAMARKHGVPILENRPLARALDAEVQLGHPVPAAHFTAVARVLAFVYRMRRGTRRA